MKNSIAKLTTILFASTLIAATVQTASATESRCNLFNLAVCTDNGEGGQDFGGGERGEGGFEGGTDGGTDGISGPDFSGIGFDG